MLASSQILTGKLVHRATNAPVRDLYDLAVGRRIDPEATAIAVNALTAYQVRMAVRSWERREAGYRNEARTELSGVPVDFRFHCGEPGPSC